MSWTTAISDVRKILSDGPTDKLAFQKKVIGRQDGTNLVYKTFEARRISSFLGTPTVPAGVFLDGLAKSVTAEDLESGQFTVAAPAPGQSQLLNATYYYRWFNDDELNEFLIDAAEWLGLSSAYIDIPEGLRPAAKEYAAHKAYQKLVSKMSVNLAETYQLYDAPDEKRFNPVSTYAKVSMDKFKLATQMRDDFYSRKGQAKAPRSVSIPGRVRDVPPNA